MAEYSLDDLYNIFMEHGLPALDAYINDNLEQFLIGTEVEADLDDLEMDNEWDEELSYEIYFSVLKELDFSEDRLKKLGARFRFNNDPKDAFDYAEEVIEGRWPEAEDIIKQDSELAHRYAKDIIGDRWPEAEEYIKQDPWSALNYAKDIIKGRWPEGEDAIKNRPGVAFWYAKQVIGGRWPEAESVIKQNLNILRSYEKFIGHKLP